MSVFLKPNNTGKVARNTSYLVASEFFIKVISVLWIVYLAHSFSLLIYGEYNYVTSLIAIFSFLPDFGVGLIVIREIARDRKGAPGFLGSSLILNLTLSLLTFFILLGTAKVLGVANDLFPYIVLSGITLILSTVRSVAVFYFDGIEKMQYSAFLNSFNSLLLIACASLGVFLGFGLFGVFGGMLVGTVISFFVSWGVLLHHVRPILSFDRKEILYYLAQGAPLGIASFASLVYTKIDILVLSNFMGDVAVGIYSAATPFAFALVQLLNVPFMVAVYPTLSRLHKEDVKRFKKGTVKSLFVTAAWSIPASIFIALIARFLIPLIFGHRYDQAIPILQILIFFVPFMCLSALLYKILIILGRQKDYLYISIAGAIINLFLNIMLIPLYGIYGAAVSAVATQAALFALYAIDVLFRLRRKQ